MTTRLANAAIVCMAGLTAIVLAVDSVVSLASGAYLNLGSGVWLALARDTHDGIFYRPLWNGAEYGGTRYFPMLFVPIAGLMRAGVPAVPAGVAISMLGLVALAAAVAVLLHRLAVPPPLAVLGTALSVAPYFVHQTAFAIRCEPIAAAFAILGLAVLVPVNARAAPTKHLFLAAALFVCAFMTKVTCLYAPAAATVALVIAGRRLAALKLAAATTVGAAVFLLVLNFASQGRAIESFRACALAGSSVLSLLSPTAVTRLLQLIGTSHLLTVVYVLTGAAVLIYRRLDLPVLYLAAALAITAVIFTSPGTILTSQIVDAYVAAIVVLTTVAAAQTGRLRSASLVLLIALTMWTAGQNVVRLSRMIDAGLIHSGTQAQEQWVEAVNSCAGTIVSESALIPVLAGRRPVLLDPFAFHVVALNRPDIGNDLVERLRRREFSCVILEQDPATPKGRAWYTNVNLTEAVMEAVLQHYALDRTIAGERFYRPTK